MVKRNSKPGDTAVKLVRHKREWIIPPVSIYEEQDNSFKNPIAKVSVPYYTVFHIDVEFGNETLSLFKLYVCLLQLKKRPGEIDNYY